MKLLNKELLLKLKHIPENASAQQLAQEVLASFKISVEVSGSVPDKVPLLLISSHPGSIDNLVLLSALHRADLSQVVLASHGDISPVWKRITHPIYRKRTYRDFIKALFINGKDSHILDNVEEIRSKNKTSISQAANQVSKGKAVVIYPTGTGGKKPEQGSWKNGVGFLATQIKNEKAVVVFVDIIGTTLFDLFRYLHPRLRSLLFSHKQVKVYFSEPVLLSTILQKNTNGKKATQLLEQRYGQIFGK